MRTIIPFSNLKDNSWAEDFTPSGDQRLRYMYVQCLGHYHSLPGYGVLNREQLHSYLFMVTIRGTGIVQYHRKEVTLPAGYATLINCDDPHSYYCSPTDDWDFRWIHFSGTCIDGYLTEYIAHWDAVALEDGESWFRDIARLARADQRISAIECSSRLIALCSELLIRLKITQDSNASAISPLIRSAMNLMEEQMAGELRLDVICSQLGNSKYYFSRTFKRETGYRPYEYLITIRLNYAKSLLRSTDETIELISEKCGFASASYFIQVFKKREALTPLHYRKYFLQITDAANR